MRGQCSGCLLIISAWHSFIPALRIGPWRTTPANHLRLCFLDVFTGADAGLDRWGFVRLARQGRAQRARPRGVWGHAPPETFWISDLLRSLLVQSEDGHHTCCTCHARNRSSAWRSQRGVLNYASYFRSGNFTFCTRPSIITLTALHPSLGPSTCASASQRRLSSPLFLL